MQEKIFVYSGVADDEFCPPEYADSIHFALSDQKGSFVPLNRNQGILFAKADISRTNEIIGKSLKNPRVVRLSDRGDGTEEYAVLARRTGHGGQPEDESGKWWLLWLTIDFISFEECGLTDVSGHPRLNGISLEPDSTGLPPGAADGSSAGISTALYERLYRYYTPVYNTGVDIPDELEVHTEEDVKNLSFTAHYSDGSTAEKRYVFDTSQADFSRAGTCTVQGSICQKPYEFPLAVGFADPVVFLWEDRYYYIATNDNTGDVGFWVREAGEVHDLFLPDTEKHLILDKDEKRGLVQTFWAPEFHVIGGRVYLLFAVSGDTFGPQCHMMRLKENGSITCAGDWEDPVRVEKKDGSFLAEAGITLDMTHFSNGGKSYLVWSYRENCMAEGDTGSMLYIASADPECPWRLTSDPVLLSRPLYGWENVAGTINNEGPYPLLTEDHIYIAYSGGSACNWTYAVGMLRIGRDQDPLCAGNWVKSSYPVLSSADLEGMYGPGHNSFFRDKNGDTYIAWHGEATAYDSPRSTMIHRVHFRTDGEPVCNLVYERDVKEEYRRITVPLKICP